MLDRNTAPLTMSDPAVVSCPFPTYQELQREFPVFHAQITRRMSNLGLRPGPTARVLAPTFFNQGVARIELEFERRA